MPTSHAPFAFAWLSLHAPLQWQGAHAEVLQDPGGGVGGSAGSTWPAASPGIAQCKAVADANPVIGRSKRRWRAAEAWYLLSTLFERSLDAGIHACPPVQHDQLGARLLELL